ncbi:MAG: transposase [Leptolyngbyaceae cyanobacterium]
MKGIGLPTAGIGWGELGSVENVGTAHQRAAFAGLTPQEFQSSTSIPGKTCLCKLGNAHRREALYFPAFLMFRYCPEIQRFARNCWPRGSTSCRSGAL